MLNRDTYANRISAVNQARAAAKKDWHASRLHIVAVGDAPQISAILKKKGTLEVFDVDGKPIQQKRIFNTGDIHHSFRKATMGFTAVARWAGIHTANTLTPASNAATAANVIGS